MAASRPWELGPPPSAAGLPHVSRNLTERFTLRRRRPRRLRSRAVGEDIQVPCSSLVRILIAMSTPERIPAGLLFLASMTLVGCADSVSLIPFGARVDPTNTGVEASIERDGLTYTYRWQVHDFDGTTHVLIWKDSTGSGREVLRDFDSCLRSRCQMIGRYSCPSSAIGADRPTPPSSFLRCLPARCRQRCPDIRRRSGHAQRSIA
jgi:hypothetical protein